jgi:hypothetical protein
MGAVVSRMVGRKAETARCIFCGKVGTWWDCGCEWGEKIRLGKLAKPRTVVRGGVPVIILCEELRAAARLAGVITREYGDEVSRIAGKTPVPVSEESRKAAKVSVTPVPDKAAVPVNVLDSGAVTDSVPDMAKCVVCGKRFVPVRATARYCSGACRVRAQRRR